MPINTETPEKQAPETTTPRPPHSPPCNSPSVHGPSDDATVSPEVSIPSHDARNASSGASSRDASSEPSSGTSTGGAESGDSEEGASPEPTDDYQPNLPVSTLVDELSGLVYDRQNVERLLCRYLADLSDRIDERLHPELIAYRDVYHAAALLFGLSARATRERIRLGRALRSLASIEAAWKAGDLAYSRVREITRVASPADEREWVALARQVDMRTLEQYVRDSTSLPGNDQREGSMRAQALGERGVRVGITLTAEAWGHLQRAMASARRSSSNPLSDAQALELVAKMAITAHLGAASSQTRSPAPPRSAGTTVRRRAPRPAAAVTQLSHSRKSPSEAGQGHTVGLSTHRVAPDLARTSGLTRNLAGADEVTTESGGVGVLTLNSVGTDVVVPNLDAINGVPPVSVGSGDMLPDSVATSASTHEKAHTLADACDLLAVLASLGACDRETLAAKSQLPLPRFFEAVTLLEICGYARSEGIQLVAA